VLELRWRRAAACFRGGFQPSETHDCQQWMAMYVGSLAISLFLTLMKSITPGTPMTPLMCYLLTLM